MAEDIKILLEDIKAHLTHQKALGNEYLPVDLNNKTGILSDANPTSNNPKNETPNIQHQTLNTPKPEISRAINPTSNIPHKTSNTKKEADLELLREELGDCTRCKLHKCGRKQIVFGDGNPDADLMFVGEGPGRDEDIQGIPFVGRAGQLLTKIIEAMGLMRSDVYIGNVIKCRPPENRNPEPDEIDACCPFLFKQIEIIKPKVIVCLGTFAAQLLLNTDEKISRLRGHFHDFHGTQLLPTYHPAFLLRNPNMKRPVWDDMQKVMEVLELSRA